MLRRTRRFKVGAVPRAVSAACPYNSFAVAAAWSTKPSMRQRITGETTNAFLHLAADIVDCSFHAAFIHDGSSGYSSNLASRKSPFVSSRASFEDLERFVPDNMCECSLTVAIATVRASETGPLFRSPFVASGFRTSAAGSEPQQAKGNHTLCLCAHLNSLEARSGPEIEHLQ